MRTVATQKQVTTTVTRRWEITAADIRKAFGLPAETKVFFTIPGGGDWSNCAMNLDEYSIEAVSKETNEETF